MLYLKNHYKFILTMLIVCALTACSSVHKKEATSLYQSEVNNSRPLVIPQNLSGEKIEDLYSLPPLKVQPQSIDVSIIPPGSTLAIEETSLHKKIKK